MSLLNKTIDLSKINNYKISQILLNLFFSLSTANVTAILIVGKNSTPIIDIILPTLSFLIILFITFKFNLLKNIFTNLNKIILYISTILGIYILFQTYLFMIKYSTTYFNLLYVILAIPATITYLYWFYTKLWYYLKLFFKSLDKTEKNYLITATSIFTIAIIIIYNVTSVFTVAQISEENKNYKLVYSEENEQTQKMGEKLLYDVFNVLGGNLLFTSDTQLIISEDVYNYINAGENDIRQPLFGLFSLPFTIVTKLIADITYKDIYFFLLAIIQGFIVFVSIVLLEKMMKLGKTTKLLFMIFLSVSYPTLLFLVNMEQYIIHVFYLIVFIYMVVNKIKDKDILYIMSTGTLITSGILFPLLGEKNNLKVSIRNIFFTFLKFLTIFIITSKILLFLPQQFDNQIQNLSNFVKREISYIEKGNMYTNFALNTIIAPKVEVSENILAKQTLIIEDNACSIFATNKFINQSDNKNTNIFGIIVLTIAILGFILNRKDLFSKICFVWIIFSVILLPIIGYGANENGFILYSYYFSWAFICLIFKFFEIILQKHSKLKNCIYSFSIVILSLINLYGIYQLITFGIQYYI